MKKDGIFCLSYVMAVVKSYIDTEREYTPPFKRDDVFAGKISPPHEIKPTRKYQKCQKRPF